MHDWNYGSEFINPHLLNIVGILAMSDSTCQTLRSSELHRSASRSFFGGDTKKKWLLWRWQGEGNEWRCGSDDGRVPSSLGGVGRGCCGGLLVAWSTGGGEVGKNLRGGGFFSVLFASMRY